MADPQHSIEKMKKWQDNIMEQAKENLLKHGNLQPVAFFMTYKKNLDQDLIAGSAVQHEQEGQLTAADLPDEAPVILIVPLLFGAAEVLSILKQTVVKEEHLPILEILEEQGKVLEVPDPVASITRALMNVMKLQDKDVTALALKLLIKKLNPFAYVKLDETWYVEAKIDEETKLESFRGNLQNHPDAQEAICSILEMDGYVRMINQLFKRDVPDTGKIIDFGEPKESVEIEDQKGDARMSGRFMNLMRKVKEESGKPAVH